MDREIEAVTFDVGGTLIEPWPSVGQVYADVAAEFGVAADAAMLTRRFGEAWRAKRDFDYSREAWFGLVRRTFEDHTELPDEFFSAVYERFAQPGVWRVFEDVLPAFDALASCGVRLAAISNWDERLQPLLEQLGLRRWFECVIVSCDVRFAKPASAIFEHALRKLALPPGTVLHVGDGEIEDRQGARSIGMQARLVDRRGRGATGATIRDLRELTALVAAA